MYVCMYVYIYIYIYIVTFCAFAIIIILHFVNMHVVQSINQYISIV